MSAFSGRIEPDTPLHEAVANNDHARAIELAKDPMLINATVYGDTPLHWAAGTGKYEMMRILLEHGANVNARDKDGATPLHRASQNLHITAMKILVEEYKADINARDANGFTPLHWAAVMPDAQETVKYLINAGADVTARGTDGLTPEQSAAAGWHRDTVAILQEAMKNRGPDFRSRVTGSQSGPDRSPESSGRSTA
jgi:ankyrin repeat protein